MSNDRQNLLYIDDLNQSDTTPNKDDLMKGKS